MELYTGPFPGILWCWSVGPGITIPLSIRRPLMRFFSRGFQHQGPLVVWSARSYLAAFYLPRLTDGSSSQDGDKRHIYSCLLATRAMNIQGCFSSSLRRKPAGQTTWPSGHVQERLQKKRLQQEDVKSEKFKCCDIHASWCHIQLSLLQLSLERRIDVTCSFQKYRTDAGSGNINTWDYPTGYDPGWGCWPTWWQPEEDAGHRKKLEDCCRNRQRSRGRIRSQDLSRH